MLMNPYQGLVAQYARLANERKLYSTRRVCTVAAARHFSKCWLRYFLCPTS
jgi:hypothetical protein